MIPIRKMLMPQTFNVKVGEEIHLIKNGLCLTENQREVLIDTLKIYQNNIYKLQEELKEIKKLYNMTKKIENCPEGGEGIVVNTKPYYLLPNDYSRCNNVTCPANDCYRLKSYLYEEKQNEIMLVTDFSKDQNIESSEDCNYYI